MSSLEGDFSQLNKLGVSRIQDGTILKVNLCNESAFVFTGRTTGHVTHEPSF
jgi:hypothetical protein